MFESNQTEVSTLPDVSNGSLTNGTASSSDLIRKPDALHTGMVYVCKECKMLKLLPPLFSWYA